MVRGAVLEISAVSATFFQNFSSFWTGLGSCFRSFMDYSYPRPAPTPHPSAPRLVRGAGEGGAGPRRCPHHAALGPPPRRRRRHRVRSGGLRRLAARFGERNVNGWRRGVLAWESAESSVALYGESRWGRCRTTTVSLQRVVRALL